MATNKLLLFGPLAAALLALGVFGLALLVPGYSQVRQTVSEIGEVGSPAQTPFTVLLVCVAACLIVFAAGVRAAATRAGHNPAAAYLVACAAVAAAGVGFFSFPHPLHNVFGQSELIGYQAPLALALTYRKDPRAARLVRFSWVMFVLVWVSLALNLVILFRHSAFWQEVRPFYGLIQRSLFGAYFAWCAGTGLLLRRIEKP